MRSTLKTLQNTIFEKVNDPNAPPGLADMETLDLTDAQKEGIMFCAACGCYFTACDMAGIKSDITEFAECNFLYTLAKASLDEKNMERLGHYIDEMFRESLL